MPPEDNDIPACSVREDSQEPHDSWRELVQQDSKSPPSTPRLESSLSLADGSPDPQEENVQVGASESPRVDMTETVPDEDLEMFYVFTIGSDPADDSESFSDNTHAGASVSDEILAMFDHFSIEQDPPEESVFGTAMSKERLGL
eukprot:jgi/Ulvmu1/3295/UM153_0007.1